MRETTAERITNNSYKYINGEGEIRYIVPQEFIEYAAALELRVIEATIKIAFYAEQIKDKNEREYFKTISGFPVMHAAYKDQYITSYIKSLYPAWDERKK